MAIVVFQRVTLQRYPGLRPGLEGEIGEWFAIVDIAGNATGGTITLGFTFQGFVNKLGLDLQAVSVFRAVSGAQAIRIGYAPGVTPALFQEWVVATTSNGDVGVSSFAPSEGMRYPRASPTTLEPVLTIVQANDNAILTSYAARGLLYPHAYVQREAVSGRAVVVS